MRRLGVFGGTFDPPHQGHLVIAERAREELALDAVLFVVASQPPHKGQQVVAPAEDRVGMVERAIADNSGFACSAMELGRPGPSYTVDTLDAIHRDDPRSELFFLLGSDSLRELGTWHRPEELVALATLVVLPRPGIAPELPQARWASAARLVALDVPGLDIASSGLRERLSRGQGVRYLVPDPVLAYIAERGLYRSH